MCSGLKIDSRFEIIAILRDGLTRKNNLDLICNGTRTLTKIKIIFPDYFVIPSNSFLPTNIIQSFALYSDSGVVIFKARYNPVLTTQLNFGRVYSFPDIIFLHQRRHHKRLHVVDIFNFHCSGQHENGEFFRMQIKNISKGGCALLPEGLCASFLCKDSLIKGGVLNFGNFGSLCLDLSVVNISPTIEYDEENQPIVTDIVSCKFLFRNKKEASAMEKIIVNILTYCKIKMYNKR